MERTGKSKSGDRDMISSLPDCLIHLIMSFLTAQEAVQTCILSKRWKNLWTTLPFLDFDLHKFEFDNEWGDYEFERREFEKFRDFVSTTLLVREASDLHKLHISCFDDGRFDLQQYHMIVKSWILYALKHNLQVFTADFELVDSLPLGVFTCATLVDASFCSFGSLHHVKVINLPRLRRLVLKGIEFNQDFVEKLFSGCPVLEFLHLAESCRGISTINSHSLKYLKMQCFCAREEAEKKLKLINAPNLLSFYLYLCPYAIGDKVHLKMPSLTSANICADWGSSGIPYKSKGILIGLSNVQHLELSGIGIKSLLENELLNCPEFSNLEDLSVGGFCLIRGYNLLVGGFCLRHGFNLLASFLNHCPSLQKLVLYYDGCKCGSQMRGNEESLAIAPFEGKQLKKVEFKFTTNDQGFPQFRKYLEDITWNSSAQINITFCYFRRFQESEGLYF